MKFVEVAVIGYVAGNVLLEDKDVRRNDNNSTDL